MTIQPKVIYRFNAISTKILKAFFTELEQIIIKLVWKCRRSQIAQATSRKKSKAGSIMPPDFKLYYKATVINQNSMVLAQKQARRSKEQNREPRNKPTPIWAVNL